MAKLNFTVKTLAALAPGNDRIDYFDTNLPGFFVRVTPADVKTFGVMFYVHGRKRRSTIGTFPPLTLADARDEAKKILSKAKLGQDPEAVKVEMRAAGTFGELAKLYMEKHGEANKAEKSIAEDQRQIDAYLSGWEHVPASAIMHDDVEAMLDKMVGRGAPVQANRTRALVRHIYAWALSFRKYRKQFALTMNPAADVPKPTREKPKDRVYSDDELKAIWMAGDRIGMAGDIFKLQLLTVARPGELSNMPWTELELGREIWTQRSVRTKSEKLHVVPLPRVAVRILKNLKARQAKLKNPEKRASRFVFYSPRNPDNPMRWLQKAELRMRRITKIEDFCPHDLRRTVITRLAEMGVPELVLKMICNHSLGRDITGRVYNQYKYFDERKHWLESWAKRLTIIVSGLKPVVKKSEQG